MSILYLSRAQVERVAPPLTEIVALLEHAFREKGGGRVEMPPKPGIHTRPNAFIHAMPCYIPALGAAGMKWVSGYPDNARRSLPYISGLLILNDVDTGVPIAVMDCTWITAYRTAAATALAARYLARPDSATAGILACGLQGRTNLEALSALFPLQRVYAYDLVPAVQEQFVAEMSEQLGLEVLGVGTPQEAVESSDLIVTSGPILTDPSPTIEAAWVRPGTFASAVDFDSYWTAEAQAAFDRIATDDHDQFAYYRKVGYFKHTPEPFADLGEIVTGRKPGRQSAEEKLMAMNLGLALEDIALAPSIYRRAREAGLGTWLEL